MFKKILIIFVIFLVLFLSVLWWNNKSKISVGWVGDMVPSTDISYNQNVFKNVSKYLSKPDLMIGNLEGTFAKEDRLTKCIFIKTMCHAFRGDVSFAQSLKSAGFDFLSLVNNHSYDYGDDGLADTTIELDKMGISYITTKNPTASIVVQGKKIGILGLSSTEPSKTITDYDFIKKEVARLKKENDFVIVIFHGGAEGADKSIVTGAPEWVGTENRGNVELVAHTAIDAGADLVLGSGPHVLRKIEVYKDSPIAYSLGNFVGASKLISTGVLSYSGIFTTILGKSKYNFLSIVLSPSGIPDIDIKDASKIFLESL